MLEAHLLPSFGLAPLITSGFPLLLELTVRWIDRKQQKVNHQQAEYFTKPWYLICQLCLFAFAVTLGVIGFAGSRGVGPYNIKQNNLACSIASYQVVLMQLALLQMYLLRILFSCRREPYCIAFQCFFAIIQLAGGVLSILNVVPRIHEPTLGDIGGPFMNAGGGGYYGALGIRALWIIGSQNVWQGFTTIVRWSRGKPLPGQGVSTQGKKHRPLLFGVAVGLVMLISSIPFFVIRKAGTKVHFIVNGTLGCFLCIFAVILRWKKLSSGTTHSSRTSVNRNIQQADDEIAEDEATAVDNNIKVSYGISVETRTLYTREEDQKAVITATAWGVKVKGGGVFDGSL